MVRWFHKVSSNGAITAAVLITLTAIITHALILPRLGYYYDDWYMLWSGASRGSKSLISLFSVDRPLIGYIYFVLYRIIRESIIGWHLVTLIVRIASGIGFYWITVMVWPKHRHISVVAAMIFVVFPGFLAEPNAATKINHLIGYTAALFSIALTLQAARTTTRKLKVMYTVLSVLLLALYVWVYEYMVGLEAMRLVLLFLLDWRAYGRNMVSSVKRVALAYIPYLLVVLLFIFWRVKVFDSTRDATDLRGLVSEYQGDFFSMALRLVFQVLKDFLSASLLPWFVQLYHLLAQAEYSQILWAILVSAIVGLIAAVYLFKVQKPGDPGLEDESPWIMVLVGGLIAMAAVFPVVLSNRYLDLMNAYKGYALHPSAGVMIAVIGIVAMLRPPYRKAALLFLLVISVMTNVLNNQVWADFWQVQRNFWWQLSWRAPDLRDDTLIMAYLPDGYAFQQDYETWGPLNLIYRPDFLSIPHIQSEVLNQGTVMDVLQGRVTDPYTRDIFVPKDFRNLLLISQPSANACIHVIDGQMPALSTSERLIVEKVSRFSDTGRIDPAGTPNVPPQSIFGREPEHTWCYYYQQAALARQTGDWGRIAELYDAAQAAGLEPADASEYFVFLEGLVNDGRAVDAEQIFGDQIQVNSDLAYSLCAGFSNPPAYPAEYGYQSEQIKQLVCQ